MADDETTGRIFCSGSFLLKLSILIFGIGTVSLSIYSHLWSPYTRKTNYPDYRQYFSIWEKEHESRTCGGENETYSLSKDAKDVLEKLPVKLGNGHESCTAFKVFLHKLAEKLVESGVKAELEQGKLDDILLCPRVLFERIFVGIGILSFTLSMLCFIINGVCMNVMRSLLNKGIDGGYHIICGLGLCCGIVLASHFLHGLKETCLNEFSLRAQFQNGLQKYQENFCSLDPNHVPSDSRRTIEQKVEEVNEKLLPKFLGLSRRSTRGDNEVTRNKAKNRALRNKRDVGENKHNEKGERARRKRKFSWNKRVYTNDEEEGVDEGSSDQGKHGATGRSMKMEGRSTGRKVMKVDSSGIHKCYVHLKIYWKIAALVVGAITSVLYIAAGINVLCTGRNMEDKKNEGQIVEQMQDEKKKDKTT